MSYDILKRIEGVVVLPETRAALGLLIEDDGNTEEALRERVLFRQILEMIYWTLGGQGDVLDPFISAWLTLRAALLRLDHLQDGDIPGSTVLGNAASSGEQYNAVFTYYVLAMAFLDDLDDSIIPTHRMRLLTRLWNDSMLWAASGQQRDLAKVGPGDEVETAFTHYQEAIEAKAGAVYGLGFGGAAMLATDDQSAISTLSLIGQVYGTLLQFSDDFLDAATQADPRLTLPQVYKTAADLSGVESEPEHLKHYWAYIYRVYLEQVRQLATNLAPELQAVLVDLFRNTFEVDNREK